MSFVFRNVLVCTIVALAFGGGTPQRAAASQKDAIDFNRDIRPILSDNCFHCHGPDAEKRKADLRLDTEAGAKSLVGGKYPIHPTNPNQGTVLERILSQDPDEQMPPPKSGRHLSEMRWRGETEPVGS